MLVSRVLVSGPLDSSDGPGTRTLAVSPQSQDSVSRLGPGIPGSVTLSQGDSPHIKCSGPWPG